MRWLMCYLRQCFCAHTFEKSEGRMSEDSDFVGKREGVRISLLCTKCGYHKSFWKFL